ncbi:MAG: hypothetical protein HY721_15915 [Planctomycetes bacterium]|nr:hypothetical protein [Planctomycetota bacterium]
MSLSSLASLAAPVARRGLRRSRAAIVVLAGIVAPFPGAAGDTLRPAPGLIAARRIPFPSTATSGGLAYAPDGRIVTYESGSGQIKVHDGGSEAARVLATFDPPVFGSFIVPSPAGDALVFGESSQGGVYSVPLGGGAPVLVDSIRFNFDLAFDPEGRGFVSAPGLARWNSIRLLDADPAAESREVVIDLEGYSGPLAFDREGDLYYGTAKAGPQSLILFARGQVEAALSGDPLVEADGLVVLADVGSFYGLRWAAGQLYFTDLGFATGTGGLYRVDPGEDFAVSPLALFEPSETGIVSPTFLALREGSRPFAPGAGPRGGSVLVWYSDFNGVNEVAELAAEAWFVRGEVNGDGVVDISDAIAVLGYLFVGGEEPEVLEAVDSNGDGGLDLSDAVYLLDYLFRGGPAIPAPFPEPGPGA